MLGGGGGGADGEAAVAAFRELASALKKLGDGSGGGASGGKAVKLKPSEKRQVGDAEKAVSLLEQRMRAGAVSSSVEAQLAEMGRACASRNFSAAHQVNQRLSTTEWNTHKDWLKGLKFLIMLGQKFQQALPKAEAAGVGEG